MGVANKIFKVNGCEVLLPMNEKLNFNENLEKETEVKQIIVSYVTGEMKVLRPGEFKNLDPSIVKEVSTLNSNINQG